jgi:uncharacterized protein with GYD domain
MILDAPDDEAVAKWALAIATNGHVRTRTTRAFTDKEFDDLLNDIESRGDKLRPPK